MKRREYQLGDIIIRYDLDEEHHVGMILYPAEKPLEKEPEKQAVLDPMVQVKLTGDMYQGCYAPGNTLRNGESTQRLKMTAQDLIEQDGKKIIRTTLKDDRGYLAVHEVSWEEGERFIRIHCSYENLSQEDIMLELLSSFSLNGISPYLDGDCAGDIRVHRIQSRWSQEGRHLEQTMEELQLESCWNLDSVRCERFGQVGSMPVSHYFPFLAMEDTRTHVYWGAQLAQPASWQMEIYRKDENIAVSGGMADREFGHWMKLLKPEEKIEAPEAIVATAAYLHRDLWKPEKKQSMQDRCVNRNCQLYLMNIVRHGDARLMKILPESYQQSKRKTFLILSLTVDGIRQMEYRGISVWGIIFRQKRYFLMDLKKR